MLNETETEETRLFCHTFIIGGISIGGPRLSGYADGNSWDTTQLLLFGNLPLLVDGGQLGCSKKCYHVEKREHFLQNFNNFWSNEKKGVIISPKLFMLRRIKRK